MESITASTSTILVNEEEEEDAVNQNNSAERTLKNSFSKTSPNRTPHLSQGHEPKRTSTPLSDAKNQLPVDVRATSLPENGLGSNNVRTTCTDPEICVDDDRTSRSSSLSSGSSSKSEARPPLTRHQKITLLSLTISCILDSASFSILLPFFPLEAEKKGVSSTVTGFIFGIYELVNFIVCPIVGKYIPVVGAKFMYLSGLFVAGGCNLLFGVLSELPDGVEFVVYCFVIRSVEAVGAAAGLTALYTIVAQTYPDRVAQMISVIETFSGIGLMLGPPVGGALYQIGGYRLPFMCLGVSVILSVIINIFLLPPLGSQQKESGSLIEVLKILPIWPVLISLFVCSMGVGFLDPTLSPHLSQFHLSPWAIGLFFFISSGVYAASSPVFGYIADNRDVTRIMMILGFYILGLGYLLLGPSHLLHLPDELWIVAVGLGLLGLGWGLTMVPPFQDMLLSAIWYGLPDNLQVQGVISGLYMSVYSLGCFVGPSMAGIMIDNLGFQVSSSILAGTCFMVTIGLGLFCCWEFQCGKGRRKPKRKLRQEEVPDEEREPLLAGNQGSINTLEKSLQDPVA